MIRLVARLVYPFWRAHYYLSGAGVRKAIEEWAARSWPDPEQGDPLRRRPYRVMAKDGITISGPATDHVGAAKHGDVIWIERGIGDILARDGAIELVDE